ncbi:MAG: hypothetical protein U0T82_13050 [Bacteroidales bacterium]
MGKKNRLAEIEPWLFVALLLLNLAPLFFTGWFPSLRGPDHLYSSNIFTSLITGDPLVKSWFEFKWFSSGISLQVILALLNLILPAWLAEKILLALLVSFLPVAFRYLVTGVQKNPVLVHLLIFPLSWNFLLMLGDYSFALAIIMGIFILGWYLRNMDDMHLRERVSLGFLMVLLVLTQAAVFMFFSFVLAVIGLVWYIENRDRHRVGLLMYLGTGLLVFLPSLILFLLILQGAADNSGFGFMGAGEHLKWLFVSRPLIVYAWDSEWPWALAFTLALALVPVWILYQRISGQMQKRTGEDGRFFLYSSLGLLLAYFFVPDSWYGFGSNLSVSILLLFYILFIGWIAIKKSPIFIQAIAVVLSLVPMLVLGVMHIHQQRGLGGSVKSMERISQQIPEGTVVYAVNCSDNWLQKNLPAYLGVEKSMVLLAPRASWTDGVVRWKPGVQDWLRKQQGGSGIDTSLFENKELMRKVQAIVFWMGENVPLRYPAFAVKMLEDYAPIDSSGSDYPSIYIRKNMFPLQGWKHETELSLKRYFNTTGKTVLDSEYLDMLRIPGEEIPKGELVWIETRAQLSQQESDAGDSVFLVVMTERNGSKLDHVMVGTGADSSSLATGIYLKYRFNEPLRKKDLVKLYIWNPDSVRAVLGKTLFRVHYFK